MHIDDLRRLVKIGEGERLEFKRKVPRPERIAKEVIAFANTRGGTLLLGVDDDGSIPGVKDVEEETFALDLALETLCDPAIPLSVEMVPVTRRRDVIVVTIDESEAKPHFLIDPEGANGRVAYVRHADMSIEASRETLHLLRWRKRDEDTQFRFGPDEQMLMRYLEEYERITVEQYARMVGRPRRSASHTLLLLTRAGVLVHHPDPKTDFFTAVVARP